MDALLRRLSERLEELASREARYREWKAAPIDEATLRAFEEAQRVQLPENHRRWLHALGESPPCPGLIGGHILGLEQSVTHFIYECFAGALDEDFAYSGREPISLEWDEEADERVDQTPLRGAVCIGHAGCDQLWIAVVSGPAADTVWGFVPGLDEELHPTGLSLPEWHLQRVERALAELPV